MTRTLVRNFHDWDYGNPVAIECPNHPANKYRWKGPGRNIHVIGAGLEAECPCPINECVVLTDGEQWTTTVKQDIGTYCLSHSGPAFEFLLSEYGFKVAVFTDIKDAIYYVNSKREQKMDPASFEPDTWTDGWTLELI